LRLRHALLEEMVRALPLQWRPKIHTGKPTKEHLEKDLRKCGKQVASASGK